METSRETIIEIKDLQRAYLLGKEEVHALDGVSLVPSSPGGQPRPIDRVTSRVNMMPTVLIAEDHPHVRSALRFVVEEKLGWEVCATAHDVLTLLAAAGRSCPDVIVVDAELNGLAAWGTHRLSELVRLIKLLCPSARLVAIGSMPETQAAVLASGVHAYVSKNEPAENLLQILEQLR